MIKIKPIMRALDKLIPRNGNATHPPKAGSGGDEHHGPQGTPDYFRRSSARESSQAEQLRRRARTQRRLSIAIAAPTVPLLVAGIVTQASNSAAFTTQAAIGVAAWAGMTGAAAAQVSSTHSESRSESLERASVRHQGYATFLERQSI